MPRITIVLGVACFIAAVANLSSAPGFPVDEHSTLSFVQAVEKSRDGGTNVVAEPPKAAAPKLDAKLASLREGVRIVLDHYRQRRLNTRDHDAWEAMHAAVAFGVETKIRVGGSSGETQTAIGWLCFNRGFRGKRILTIQNGRPIGIIGVGKQGHHGQLLAILAQSRLKADYPLWVAGREFTVMDLVESEKRTCRPGQELTFKLIGLSHYLPSDATWKCNVGRTWSIQRLIHEEIKQPIQGATCGGTHRLMGLSYAVRKRSKEGKPLTGEFKRANEYLNEYHRYAFRLQNPDGSFSTKWLEYREARPDLDRRLRTTGHILEWLAFSLNERQLNSPDMIRAVKYLSRILWKHRKRRWELGPLGHALHGLVIFDRRMFKTIEDQFLEPASTIETESRSDARLEADVAADPLKKQLKLAT